MGIFNGPAQWKQTASALLANLLSIHMGMILSWIIISFDQPKEELYMLGENADMLDSLELEGFRRLPFVCILVTLPLGAYLSERFGRKMTLALSGIPFVICFILIAVARNLLWIFTAITFGGVACALQFYVVPMYVHEISSGSRSGAHSVIQTMFVGIGIFLGQMLIRLWMTTVIAVLCIILPVGFVMMVAILPESPVWFERARRTTYARRVRTMLILDDPSSAAFEVEILNEEEVGNVQPPNSEPAEFERMFEYSGSWKGFAVSAGLLVGQAVLQMNIFGVIMTTAVAMHSIVSDPAVEMIILSLMINISILILVCIVTSFLIDRLGRRPLLIVSYVCLIIALLLKCAFYESKFVVLIAVAYYIFYFLGVSALSVIAVEIIPSNVVSYVYAISTGIFWIVTWIVVEIFKSYGEMINGQFVWFGQAIICALLLTFVCLCIPETKRKSPLASGRVWSS